MEGVETGTVSNSGAEEGGSSAVTAIAFSTGSLAVSCVDQQLDHDLFGVGLVPCIFQVEEGVEYSGGQNDDQQGGQAEEQT